MVLRIGIEKVVGNLTETDPKDSVALCSMLAGKHPKGPIGRWTMTSY